jgi:hypothetical protein
VIVDLLAHTDSKSTFTRPVSVDSGPYAVAETSNSIRVWIGFHRNDGTSYSGSPSIAFGSIAT